MTDTTTDNGEEGEPTVVIDDMAIDAEQFVDQLDAVYRAEQRLEELQATVEAIETGLNEEDAVRLIYGRSSGYSLSDVRGLFDTLDQISGAHDKKLVVRLLADLGNFTLDEADEFYEEVFRLRQRYGDLANE